MASWLHLGCHWLPGQCRVAAGLCPGRAGSSIFWQEVELLTNLQFVVCRSGRYSALTIAQRRCGRSSRESSRWLAVMERLGGSNSTSLAPENSLGLVFGGVASLANAAGYLRRGWPRKGSCVGEDGGKPAQAAMGARPVFPSFHGPLR